MSDGVTCPKGQPVGACCAIKPAGSVYLQELLNCRADVAKRVPIIKRAARGAEEAPMSEPVNVAKALYAMMDQKAENLRRERPGLTKPEALIKVAEQHPPLYNAYAEAMRRGPSPEERWPTAPVTKAAPTAQDQAYAVIETRAEAIVKARGGAKRDAIGEVLRDAPELYATYRQSFARGGRPSADGED